MTHLEQLLLRIGFLDTNNPNKIMHTLRRIFGRANLSDRDVTIGHSQNLWKFTRDRWMDTASQGGGGDAPARFFSNPLWGTIIYPDETSQLPAAIRNQVFTPSPFSGPVTSNLPWSRWDSGKHLVYLLAQQFSAMAAEKDPRKNAKAAIALLDRSISLHTAIQQSNVFLGDNKAAYQANWKAALDPNQASL